MTGVLVKLFIKDSENVENAKVRTKYGVLSSIVGIICNVMLFTVKLIIGMIINSISVMADAFNNLSDAASSVVGLVGVKLAERPADEEHPFGHGRYEYIAALVVAFLVFQVGFSCFKGSIDKIIHPQVIEFKLILIIILAASILVKVWLALFNRKLGNKINSTVMKATATDALGDVLATSATVISIIVGKISGLKIDGYMGVIVSCMVLFAAINIMKDTLKPLIGQAADRDVYKKISTMVESYDGIVGTHDLIVHSYGPTNTMATIHAEVPNDINIEVAHETIDKIERDANTNMGIFLVIHMDPIEINDICVLEAKKMIVDIVSSIEERASIHDFRMVNGEEQANLIFDTVVPYSYGEEKEKELKIKIIEAVEEKNEKYKCVITVEKSYVKE